MLEKPIKSSKREINLIPMINVIFLLLTFFMVAGTIEKLDPFSLSLPDAVKKGTNKPQRVNVVYLHKDGRIAVNDDMVAIQDLSTIINTLFIDNKGQELIIKADKEASSKDLIGIIGIIEKHGVHDVTIVTKISGNK